MWCWGGGRLNWKEQDGRGRMGICTESFIKRKREIENVIGCCHFDVGVVPKPTRNYCQTFFYIMKGGGGC